MSKIQNPTCKLIRPGGSYEGKQAFTYFSGISAENTGATGICMHLLTIQPGQRARAHLHEGHETAIYVLEGEAEMWYGQNLSEHMTVRKGEYLYIPAGMPHLPFARHRRQAGSIQYNAPLPEAEVSLLACGRDLHQRGSRRAQEARSGCPDGPGHLHLLTAGGAGSPRWRGWGRA